MPFTDRGETMTITGEQTARRTAYQESKGEWIMALRKILLVTQVRKAEQSQLLLLWVQRLLIRRKRQQWLVGSFGFSVLPMLFKEVNKFITNVVMPQELAIL